MCVCRMEFSVKRNKYRACIHASDLSVPRNTNRKCRLRMRAADRIKFEFFLNASAIVKKKHQIVFLYGCNELLLLNATNTTEPVSIVA